MSALATHDVTSGELAAIAVRANDCYHRARLGFKLALDAGIEAGHALNEAKAMVGYGEWAGWLADKFQGSERTASFTCASRERCRSSTNKDATPLRI